MPKTWCNAEEKGPHRCRLFSPCFPYGALPSDERARKSHVAECESEEKEREKNEKERERGIRRDRRSKRESAQRMGREWVGKGMEESEKEVEEEKE